MQPYDVDQETEGAVAEGREQDRRLSAPELLKRRLDVGPCCENGRCRVIGCERTGLLPGSRRTIQPVPVLADLAAALRGPGLVEDPILFLPQKLVQKLRR